MVILPWPLNEASEWFTELWNWISRAAYNAANWVYTNIRNSVMWIYNNLRSVVIWVYDSLKGSFDWVVRNLRSLLDWVYSGLKGAIDWIYAGITHTITWLYNTLQGSITWVVTRLSEVGTWIVNTMTPLINGVITTISSILGNISSTIMTAIDETKTFMETILHGALSGVAEKLGEGLDIFWKRFVGNITWFISELMGFINWAIDALTTTLNDIITNITNRIRLALKPGSPPVEMEEAMTGLATEYYEKVMAGINTGVTGSFDINLAVPIAVGLTTTSVGVASVAMAMSMAGDSVHPTHEIGLRETSKLVLSYIGADRLAAPLIVVPHTEGVVVGMQQFFRKIFRLTAPGPSELNTMLYRGKIDEGKYGDWMARHGYEDEFIDGLKEAGYTIPDVRVLYELNWRGLLSDADLKKWTTHAGIQPQLLDGIYELRNLIPPSKDLVTMVVREAFKELAPERMLQHWEDAPGIFTANMRKKGFSKDWADRYWMAHWLPMPLTQAKEALHRGFMPMEDFEFLLKIADYHPMWREPMKKVAYRTWRIRDMRIGWELGVLDDEKLLKRLLDYGYPPDDVEDIMRVMKSYALAAEIGDVRREIIKDFTEGFIDEDTLAANLLAIGTPESVSVYYVEKAKMRRDRDLAKEWVKIYTTAFRKGTIDSVTFRGNLKELGLLDDWVNTIVTGEETRKGYEVA